MDGASSSSALDTSIGALDFLSFIGSLGRGRSSSSEGVGVEKAEPDFSDSLLTGEVLRAGDDAAARSSSVRVARAFGPSRLRFLPFLLLLLGIGLNALDWR